MPRSVLKTKLVEAVNSTEETALVAVQQSTTLTVTVDNEVRTKAVPTAAASTSTDLPYLH